jgi:hypothetical protein
MIQERNFPKKSRIGCVAQFWIMVGLVALFLLGFQALFMPWAYYLGGHFHYLPEWSGMGTAHAANGKDYIVFVKVYPNVRHPGRFDTSLQDIGFVCTPKGEKIRMSGNASMDKHLGVDTQGKKIRVGIHRTGTIASFVNSDYRPSITFDGIWGKDEIVGDDRGSLGRAFEPDGSVYQGHSPTRGPSFPAVQFTLRAASKNDFDKACSAQM